MLPADTAVVAIGQRPRRDLLGWIEGLELERSRIRSIPRRAGQAAKYYAGGDAVNGGATVVEAVAHAKLAAARSMLDPETGDDRDSLARRGPGGHDPQPISLLTPLQAGKSAQAFPEYGPERRGAPVQAYTRIDDRPIRRHDSVTAPRAVVVLDPSLLGEPTVVDGVRARDDLARRRRRSAEPQRHAGRAGRRPGARREGRNDVRQPRDGRGTGRGAGRASVRVRGRGGRRAAASKAGAELPPTPRSRGIRVAELRPWQQLATGGIVLRDGAPRLRTGGWRTGA